MSKLPNAGVGNSNINVFFESTVTANYYAHLIVHSTTCNKRHIYTRLKITDSRSPVMMTGQIFFSPDKARFWPVKLMNIIIFFLPMEYRITLEVDRCTALSFKFLPASW